MGKLKPKFIVGGGGLNGVLVVTTKETSARMTSKSMPGNIITDDYDGKDLFTFINKVIEGKNVKAEYSNSKDEYWTNGYTAKVVEKDGKKMFKIFFRLTDDYEPYYIDIEEFKELVDIFVKEKAKFDQDPEKYKEELRKKGGIVIE